MGVGRRLVLTLVAAIALISLSATAAVAEPPSGGEPATSGATDPAGSAGETVAGVAPTPAAAAAGKKVGPKQGGPKEGEPKGGADRQKSTLRLRLKGIRKGRVPVGRSFKAIGTLRPFRGGERVTVILSRGKKTVKRKSMFVRKKPGANYGKFRFSKRLVRSGRYKVRAIHRASDELSRSRGHTRSFKVRFPSLRKGNRGKQVALANRLLARFGYVNDKGKKFDSATARAVLAYRKVNGMARNSKLTSRIFKRLSVGKGKFKLKHPGAGKHVEADLSRQVLVLAKGGKVKEIYHTSSGAPATPTIRGKFRFYRKDAGYNSIGMYYSAYFIRGYATHGYKSVPTYPASHGCLRTPIPDARHIYNWISIGDPIYVYR